MVTTVKGNKRFFEVHELLKKKFKAFEGPINFYASQTFPVYPNAYLRDIYENFGTKEGNDKGLTLHYSKIEAWG